MRLGNRIYRILGKLELPKYFLNLHPDCVIRAQTGSLRYKYGIHVKIPQWVRTYTAMFTAIFVASSLTSGVSSGCTLGSSNPSPISAL